MRLDLHLPRPLAICGAASLSTQLDIAPDARQRKQMSRAAFLALRLLRQLLDDAQFIDGRDGIGAFLGVGSSGPALDELSALLASSVDDGAFSLQRFGERGLYAANPLLAFQLMNNFTLCHGTIDCRLGGPSGAYFSRGSGTVFALHAAAWAILDGDCTRAVAGGADSALHPVTRSELERQGALAAGLSPGEGAAALALSDEKTASDCELFACAIVPGEPLSAPESLLRVLDAAALLPAVDAVLSSEVMKDVDAVVTSGAVEALRDLFAGRLARRFASSLPHHLETATVETLAAAPALAWFSAVELLRRGSARRVIVLSAGLDGDLGVVGLRRRS